MVERNDVLKCNVEVSCNLIESPSGLILKKKLTDRVLPVVKLLPL
jgi:hypothetical protein